MTKTEKDFFGKGFKLKAEVTNGKCPVCESPTVFVSLYKNFYRCMHCGGDTEQKVNGVISYIPASVAGSKRPVLVQSPDISEDNG
mgnify:CR=1 FL=1|jgi:uncharacterized protein (DUF983 family)